MSAIDNHFSPHVTLQVFNSAIALSQQWHTSCSMVSPWKTDIFTYTILFPMPHQQCHSTDAATPLTVHRN